MTLSLDTRQRAMLAAMGVRVWQPTPAVQALARVPQTAPSPVVPAATATPNIALKALPAGLAEMDWAALQNAASHLPSLWPVRNTPAQRVQQQRHLARISLGRLAHHHRPAQRRRRAQGRTVCHAEGELFDAMLQALGMSRLATSGPLDATVVPVLKCRVPAQRNPHTEELQQCRSLP
jgi:uracil-DNA glycosylase